MQIPTAVDALSALAHASRLARVGRRLRPCEYPDILNDPADLADRLHHAVEILPRLLVGSLQTIPDQRRQCHGRL